MKKQCIICSKEFITKPSHYKRRKYCSYTCYWKSLKNQTTWNKGTKGIMKSNKTSFKRGHPAPKTAFKKGQFTETSHPNYKGKNINYCYLHKWVIKHKNNPKKCSICNLIGKKSGRNWNIEWANIDHKYHRNLDDFIALCDKCHKQYDANHNGKSNTSQPNQQSQ